MKETNTKDKNMINNRDEALSALQEVRTHVYTTSNEPILEWLLHATISELIGAKTARKHALATAIAYIKQEEENTEYNNAS